VDFLLLLIELLSLGVTAEALRPSIGSKSAISLQRGLVDPKFQVEGVAPTNRFSVIIVCTKFERNRTLPGGVSIGTKICDRKLP